MSNEKKTFRAIAFGQNVNGQTAITPKIPSDPEEMGIYIHVDDVGGKSDLFTNATELLAATKLALSIAEGHIKSEYEGTSAIKRLLAELDPVREMIKKVEDKKCQS